MKRLRRIDRKILLLEQVEEFLACQVEAHFFQGREGEGYQDFNDETEDRGIDPASGREIFIKKDGTQTFEHDYADEVVVGNSDPKVEGVIGTSFYYKGFSASVNLRYRLGGQIFMSTLYDKVENISENALQYNQDKRALYDRWQKPGDVSKYKSISLTDATPMSSRFIADENTLSGESISLGYETQAKWLHRIGASSMTIRGYMNDIFRISTVKNERGLDYPFARTVAFSLGLTF